jgi:hypothetical protein
LAPAARLVTAYSLKCGSSALIVCAWRSTVAAIDVVEPDEST